MKELSIDLVYENIDEVIVDKHRNLIIKFKNGDRLTLEKGDKTKRIRKHLIKNFSGEHLD